MKRLLALLFLFGLSTCGPPAATPKIVLSMRQALRAEVTAVELAAFDGTNTCADLAAGKADWQSWGLCTGEVYSGTPPCKIVRARLGLDEFDPSQPVSLYVPTGERIIAAVGLDEGEAIVGFGCSGPHTIAASGTTRVDLTLE